jgi:hypothetical protein
MAIWRMRIACWILKCTYTHSEYVTFIAYTLKQLLHERTTKLCYTYIVLFKLYAVCIVRDLMPF